MTVDRPIGARALELWPVGRLKAYERNARTHPKAQLKQLAESIKQFGFNAPILVDQHGTVIAGHGRLQAAVNVGLLEVPVVVLDHLSDAERRAYIIADNKIADNSDWDEDLLAQEIADLRLADIDMAAIGFDQKAIDKLLAAAEHGAEGTSEEAAAQERAADAVTRAGDIWHLGEHRIGCGDSTAADAVKALLGADVPVLMVTDPPYGVEYDPAWRQRVNKGATAIGTIRNDDRADWREAWMLFPGNVAYVWHGAKHASEVQQSLEVCGFEIRAQIVWSKQHFALSRGDYHWQHEPCWYAVRKGSPSGFTGDRTQSTVWQIANNGSFGGGGETPTGHSTQKPLECMRRPMINNSRQGDAVYDPFLGSGSSLISAEMLGRRCLGMELDPGWVDAAIKRWQSHAGKAATLAATGQTFAEVESLRRTTI